MSFKKYTNEQGYPRLEDERGFEYSLKRPTATGNDWQCLTRQNGAGKN